MARFFELDDDGRRCTRCKSRCQIFGQRDPETGWVGYCSACYYEWHHWHWDFHTRTCNRKCWIYSLHGIIPKQICAELVESFLDGSVTPEELVLMYSERHWFKLVQLSWLSFNWCEESTDSEAEQARYEFPTLHSLREVPVYAKLNEFKGRNKSERRPCLLLDLVCSFLYHDQVRVHMIRHPLRRSLLRKQQFDWEMYTDGYRLVLHRLLTGEGFYIHNPPQVWRRYQWADSKGEPFYWWFNYKSSAWFFEPISLSILRNGSSSEEGGGYL